MKNITISIDDATYASIITAFASNVGYQSSVPDPRSPGQAVPNPISVDQALQNLLSAILVQHVLKYQIGQSTQQISSAAATIQGNITTGLATTPIA